MTRKENSSFVYSIAFQVFLYFVLACSTVAVALSIPAMAYLYTKGGYTTSFTDYMTAAFHDEAYRHLNAVLAQMDEDSTMRDIEDAFKAESENNNVAYVIEWQGYRLWSNNQDKKSDYVFHCGKPNKWFNNQYRRKNYVFTMYVYTDFEKNDNFSLIYQIAELLYRYRYILMGILFVFGVLIFVPIVWLICLVGHKRGREGIAPGMLTSLPLELLTAVFLFLVWVPFAIAGQLDILRVIKEHSAFFYEELTAFTLLAVFSVAEVLLITVFLREFALRAKLGKWWRNSLIYRIRNIFWLLFKHIVSFVMMLVRGIPTILFVAIAVAALTAGEFVGLCNARSHLQILFAFWLLEKIILIPLTLYLALSFKRLQAGSRALAEGNLSHKLDMTYLVFAFKRHAENLNRIGEGISKAVEQRMQSERLKTELITNVSHDIKTPLTSVINYADLLGAVVQEKEGELDREKIEEYSEVLLRQSRRLKKLLDDLLEASKATTGNLEVHLVPCEISVLLAQAAGEYEARFAAQGLNLVVNQPEETIRIMADGRHIWRVFDNLFNNICKYAQEGSRVYLNVERKEERVEVIFRNMSKYELNISPQELEERFVRGDKSRNLEGNGLGLSIAKSLVELQNGSMQIVTDGDLFKVILSFAMLEDDVS